VPRRIFAHVSTLLTYLGDETVNRLRCACTSMEYWHGLSYVRLPIHQVTNNWILEYLRYSKLLVWIGILTCVSGPEPQTQPIQWPPPHPNRQAAQPGNNYSALRSTLPRMQSRTPLVSLVENSYPSIFPSHPLQASPA